MSPQPPAGRLSEELSELRKETMGETLTLGEIRERLHRRGYALVMLILAIPALIPIPGVSAPFGVALLLMGAQIALGREPWLPDKILKRPISAPTAANMLAQLHKVSLRMERFVRPRMQFLRRWPGMINLIGVGIFLSSLFLLLPLPIPFTNLFPAISILLLSAGLMERDGVCVLLGYFFGLLSWGYLGVLFYLGQQGFEWFQMHSFKSFFQ